jgi:cellulose synthase/poly-beta-1,6-N-acetylglucosamine synthase-like glycosyltransferase
VSAPLDPFASLPPPDPACRATVVIPAHDEAERIARTLGALAAQTQVDGTPLERGLFDVLVYANNCSDGTAAVVRAFAAAHPSAPIHLAEGWLPPNVAHIGTARRLAMNAAARRLAGVRDAVLAATDADTIPAPAWLAWTLREIAGVDAVTGRILVDPRELRALPERTQRMLYQENAYLFAVARLSTLLDPRPYDPWPRHWQRSGPSFAVRVEAYRSVGGVPAVRVFEDVALYDALEASGAAVRHSLRVRVSTSARTVSRAPGGFGTRVAEWDGSGDSAAGLLVEHPEVTARRLREGRSYESSPHEPCVPATEATAALRQLIARGGKADRATFSSVMSMAG